MAKMFIFFRAFYGMKLQMNGTCMVLLKIYSGLSMVGKKSPWPTNPKEEFL
jgi:hypothetical protein